MNTPPAEPLRAPTRSCWLALGLAIAWIIAVRVPIVLNAATHLDSDLAVDGLMVNEIAQGRWHWHFPGTPHIGIASAVFAAPQMRIWGMSPITLTSGGVLEYCALTFAIFLLAKTVYGLRVACCSLVPLAFSSTGLVWFAGRLNSGHLLAAIWYAGALTLLYQAVKRSRAICWAVLGLWCGLGLWHDWMFLISLVALVLVAVVCWGLSGSANRALRWSLAFCAGLVVGDLPREVGNRLEPYDAYQEQMDPLWNTEVLLGHTRILAAECLPRLVAGHLLPDLRSEPAAGPGTASHGKGWVALAVTGLCLWLFVAGAGAILGDAVLSDVLARRAVGWAILLSTAAIGAAFILNRNIFNSDNYRYIITWTIPWAIGFGLVLDRLARLGRAGRWLAAALAVALGMLMTVDTAQWYRGFGWVDPNYLPVRRQVRDRALGWLNVHREVEAIFGGYWDVYRLMFLTGGRVVGVPYPVYPNRFPEWGQRFPGGRPNILIARPTPEGALFYQQAKAAGARVLVQDADLAIVDWPVGN